MITPQICPKCSGEMKKGNFSGSQTGWQDTPDKSFLQATGHKIDTYACEKCGYLESYARK